VFGHYHRSDEAVRPIIETALCRNIPPAIVSYHRWLVRLLAACSLALENAMMMMLVHMFSALLILAAWPLQTNLHAATLPLLAMDEAEAAAQPPAATQPDSAVEQKQPEENQQPQQSVAADPVYDLLGRLERSAKDLHAFTAKIAFEKEDGLVGRTELRTGELIYRLDQDTQEKSFAILLDAVIINNVRRPSEKNYIFNGRWLVEVDPSQRQFIKREVVPPGQQLDPLKLGEGPFPLPIGQPRDEVLARFDVSPATLPATGMLQHLENVEGLLLVPKPGTQEAREYERVELFYDRDTLLPVGINAVEVRGNRQTVRLSDIKRNPALDEATLAKLDIREPDPREWRIDVRPWQAPQE